MLMDVFMVRVKCENKPQTLQEKHIIILLLMYTVFKCFTIFFAARVNIKRIAKVDISF